MKGLTIFFFISLTSLSAFGKAKTIHIFVALCDNINQGIDPVPEKLGNGQDPKNNLYWGAMYGIKSYFKYRTEEWKLISSPKSENSCVLERLLFKHKTKDVYILAEAYNGLNIKNCTEDFLKSSNGQHHISIIDGESTLQFGGKSDLVSYVGHDGLMDFEIKLNYNPVSTTKRDVIILACYSKNYFSQNVKNAGANPILWTTNLMAPEAYSLKAAIDGWILNESNSEIEERAAQAYKRYQKCSLIGARNLFTTGF